MISSEHKPPLHNSTDTNTWTYCKYEHDEFTRYHYSTTVFEDKLVIFGGQGSLSICSDLILLDPATKAFKIIPSTIDKVCGYRDPSACQWTDNKLILFGGENAGAVNPCVSTVSVLTFKGLESESVNVIIPIDPSADLQKVTTPTEVFRGRHSAHIYEDKMYVFGGISTSSHEPDRQDVWCLDLTTFTWNQVSFEGWKPIPGDQNGLLTLTCIFDENKAYIIPMTHIRDPELTIQEFNLDTMTCAEIKIPGPPGRPYYCKFSKQIIDGKFYAFTKRWITETQSVYDLSTLDFSSKIWVNIETEHHPLDFDNHAQFVLCNNQLVYQCSNELWTLPFTKQSTPVQITKSQQVLKELFVEAPYSDISFEIESEIIKAHKWMLAKKSKYFANMFASGMSEAQASTIKITDMTVLTFKALLEFLYSDHVELNTPLALELLKQADKYSIAELKKECEAYLSQSIEPENFVLLGQTAELLEAETLREAVVAYITKNIKKLKKRTDLNLNALSEGFLRDTIVKLDAK